MSLDGTRHTPLLEVTYLQIGYLCIQGYPSRICSGCTTACTQPVFLKESEEA